MFCFTNFNLDEEQKYRTGYSMIIFMAFTFLVNVFKMIVKNVERWKNKKRAEYNRYYFRRNINEILRLEHVERRYAAKKNGGTLKEQFIKQEENRMIRQAEQAFLKAPKNKLLAAKIVMDEF